MIRTSHQLTLSIDDTAYSVVVRDLTKKESLELTKKSKELDSTRREFNKKRQALQRVQNELELNEEIKLQEKVDVAFLKKQKALYERYYKLNDEVEKIEINIPSDEEVKRKIAKETLALRVGGEDAKAFLGAVEEKNINYVSIFQAIGLAIKEAEEKK